MEIFHDIRNYRPRSSSVVTIGTFDGVHLGHQKLISSLIQESRSGKGHAVLLTFWPHPRMVINHENSFKLLSTLENKMELFRKHKVDDLIIIPFTEAFSRISPVEFIRGYLVERIQAASIIIGYDHRFGAQRQGSFSLIEEAAREKNIAVHEVSALLIDGIAVSSSKIRTALHTGAIDLANRMLGYPYFVSAKVVKGLGLGVRLGFPTANLALTEENKLVPADGIYIVKAYLQNRDAYYGLLNIGENPTVSGKGRSVELHILEFQGDIYDRTVKIMFLSRIRDEIRFDSLEALQERMKQDKAIALSFLEQYQKGDEQKQN
jgi:riboflavin kinase / FMN adenylyltransferase